jgi:hypothetical protein
MARTFPSPLQLIRAAGFAFALGSTVTALSAVNLALFYVL